MSITLQHSGHPSLEKKVDIMKANSKFNDFLTEEHTYSGSLFPNEVSAKIV